MNNENMAMRMADESEVDTVTSVLVPREDYAIVRDIMRERQHQNEKWGEQNHSLCGWISILTEEVGEAAKEAVDLELGEKGSIDRFRTEMVQVAAVAVQILEALDRQEDL